MHRDLIKEFGLNRGRQDAEYAINYHNMRKEQRREWAIKLAEELDFDKNKTFASLGCGYAGEESIWAGYFKHGVLIDRYEPTTKYLKDIYDNLGINNVDIVCSDVENYDEKIKFDFIYTSSPGTWNQLKKIYFWYTPPEMYTNFFSKYLKRDGIIVVKHYAWPILGWSKEEQKSDEQLNMFEDNLNRYGLTCFKRDIGEHPENNLFYIRRT